jgi:hypothetical protein
MDAIPILSLVVAVLAVFVGPLISWVITKRQLEAAVRIASLQIVAPMRQTWINELRQKLSEFSSSALHYFVAGFENRTDAEYKRMAALEHEIALMLSPDDQPEHGELLQAIRKMLAALETASTRSDEFVEAQNKAEDLSRSILKTEWQNVEERYLSSGNFVTGKGSGWRVLS